MPGTARRTGAGSGRCSTSARSSSISACCSYQGRESFLSFFSRMTGARHVLVLCLGCYGSHHASEGGPYGKEPTGTKHGRSRRIRWRREAAGATGRSVVKRSTAPAKGVVQGASSDRRRSHAAA
jgi:hypothetical protein